jgi:hypothetical protein
MKVSFFHLFARATPSLVKLQIHEKMYDFYNYIVVQINIETFLINMKDRNMVSIRYSFHNKMNIRK